MKLRGLLIFSFLIILVIFTLISTFCLGSLYADIGLICRGVTAKKGPNYFYQYDRDFLMGFIHNDNKTIFSLSGEIFNPSFFPVYLQVFNYKIYLNDTFMLEDKIEGAWIFPNSYLSITRIVEIDNSAFNSTQIEALKLLRTHETEEPTRITVEGIISASCNSFTRSKPVKMTR